MSPTRSFRISLDGTAGARFLSHDFGVGTRHVRVAFALDVPSDIPNTEVVSFDDPASDKSLFVFAQGGQIWLVEQEESASYFMKVPAREIPPSWMRYELAVDLDKGTLVLHDQDGNTTRLDIVRQHSAIGALRVGVTYTEGGHADDIYWDDVGIQVF
jgi:hypothetical protein